MPFSWHKRLRRDPMKEKTLAIGSTLSALLASLCCLGPLFLGGAGLGAMLVATFAPLRPYFLTLSAILLAGGFLVYRKPKAAEACAGETCAPEGKTRRMAKSLLWTAALAVLVLAFFPSYGVRLVGRPAVPAPVSFAALQTAELKITGMDCPVCSGLIQRKLLETPGVVGAAPEARVSSRDRGLAAPGGSRVESGSLSPQRGPRRIRNFGTRGVIYGEQSPAIQCGSHGHPRRQSFYYAHPRGSRL